MSYVRRSRFVFGTSIWATELSARPWIPSDSTVGGSRTAAAGIAASYIVRRDALVELPLRVSEDEWPDLLALVAYGQTSQAFTWFPDADESDSRLVYLEAPLAGEKWEPSRMGEFERVFEVTLTLRAVAEVDPWVEYFTDAPAGPSDPVVASVVVLPTSVNVPVGGGQVLQGQGVNVSLETVPGAVVTWTSADPTVATVGGDATADGLVHTVNVSGVTIGSTTVQGYVNGVPTAPVPVTVVAATPGTEYWRDDQAGGVFGAFSGGYGWNNFAGGYWNPAPSVVADADSPTGYAVRFRYNATPGGSLCEARIIFGAHLTDVYMGWNIKFPLNYFHRNGPSSDNNKMLRVWGNAYSTSEGDGDKGISSGFSSLPSPASGGGSFFDFRTQTSGRTTGDGPVYAFTSAPFGFSGVRLDTNLGMYRRFVYRVKAATGPGMNDGIVQFWIDGVLMWNRTDVDLWDYSAVQHNYFNHMYILGAANSGFNVQTDILVQDVAIGSTYSDVA